MADNEKIGGIEVEVGGTDSGVEAMLDRLEQRLKTFYDKYGNGTVNVNASTSAGGGGGSSRATRAAEADANTVRFGKGAMGSASGSEYAKLEAAITKQAAQQKIAFREVAQNVSHPSASTRASAPMVRQQAEDTSVDTSQITTIVAAVLAAAAKNPSALGRLAKAFPKTSDTPATSTSGGAGGIRRGQHEVRFDTETPPGGAQEGRQSAATAPLRNGPADPRAIDAANASRLAAQRQIAAGTNETPEQQNAREQAKTNAEPPADKQESEKERKDRERQERAANAKARRRSEAQERDYTAMDTRSERRDTSFETRVGKGAFGRQIQQAQIQRSQEQAVISREAEVQAAGRTPHTMASSLSSFFLGPRQEQIAAQAGLNSARQQTASATKYLNIFENEMIANEVKATHVSSDEAKVLRDKNKAIKDSTQYAGAAKGQTDALTAEGTAAERLGKLSSGVGTAARNLLAVTAGGAAFSVGMQAVGVVTGAVLPALQNFMDIQTGFSATSSKVTTALGTQTLAMKGNAAEALAAAEAQAGLSSAASDSLNTQLMLATQIKAGAQAQGQSSQLLRAAAGVGNAQSGLYGGYGGVAGSGLFAQQLGGGMGYSEQIAQDVQGIRGGGGMGTAPSDILNSGISMLTDSKARQFALNKAFGNTGGQAVGIGIQALTGNALPSAGPNAPLDPKSLMLMWTEATSINANIKKGAKSLGQTASATYMITQNSDLMQVAATTAAAASDWSGVENALNGLVMLNDKGKAMTDVSQYKAATQQGAVGAGIQSPDQMAAAALRAEQQRQVEAAASVQAIQSQQAYVRPGFLAGLQRQQDVALGTQIPAQAALANIAAPPTPVGTGIVAANAAEQAKINAGSTTTIALQKTLNAYYAQGKQVLMDTYHIPAQILDQMTTVGQQIASTQAVISNESAGYATAQYNYQLFIAKRSLSDIAGLTGQNLGAGQSTLGVLERQNLLLGRQGQMLQFGLSQRQINLQVATAGFAAPGTTAEARAANIQEAKIEASYAQKQLDIQKQMFGNQVKIVDITNLRQGTDLLRQIGLLQQGRAVTIDTALAQQKLARLQKTQERLTAEAGTYITKVDAQIAQAMSDMGALEAATGKAISNAEKQGIAAVYGVGSAFLMVISGGLLGAGSKTSYQSPTDTLGGTSSGQHASGVLGNTSGPTSMTVGEAGTETVAVLRNPRSVMSGGMGSGGSVVININNPNVRNDGDLYAMKKMILDVLNQKAALQGLRGTVLQ